MQGANLFKAFSDNSHVVLAQQSGMQAIRGPDDVSIMRQYHLSQALEHGGRT
jgi:hypothetical protein